MVFLAYTLIIVLGIFEAAAYGVLLLGPIGGVCFAVRGAVRSGFQSKRVAERLAAWRTPSTLLFLVLILGFAAFTQGMETFPSHDNYSFWARAVRELWALDSFYIHAGSNIAHSDYCPAISALQYCAVRVFGWRNEYLCYVLFAMSAASLSAIYDRFTWARCAPAVLSVLAVLALYPLTAATYDIGELYIDGPMALLFAAAVVVWTEQTDAPAGGGGGALPVLLAAFVLVTAKPYSGLMMAAVLFLAMLWSRIKRRERRGLAVTMLMAALILYAQFSWSAVYNYHTAIKAYDTQIANHEYLNVAYVPDAERPSFHWKYLFSGNPRSSKLLDGDMVQTLRHNWATAAWLKELATKKLSGTEHPCVTVLSATAATLLLMLLVYATSDGEAKSRIKSAYLVSSAACLLYMAGMLATFLVVQPEASSSAIRYAGVILLILQNILLRYLAEQCARKNAKSICIFAAVAVLLAVFLSPKQLVKAYCVNTAYASMSFAQSGMDSVRGRLAPSDRVLYIDNRDPEGKWISSSGVIYCYQYAALPERATALWHRYGDSAAMESVTEAALTDRLAAERANKIVILADDADCAKRYSEILHVAVPVGRACIVDVTVRGGAYHFSLE